MKLSVLKVIETAEDVSAVLLYAKSLMSKEMIDRFSELFSELAEKMLDVDDPKKVMIADFLK